MQYRCFRESCSDGIIVHIGYSKQHHPLSKPGKHFMNIFDIMFFHHQSGERVLEYVFLDERSKHDFSTFVNDEPLYGEFMCKDSVDEIVFVPKNVDLIQLWLTKYPELMI